MAAPSCATAFTDANRSRRAMSEIAQQSGADRSDAGAGRLAAIDLGSNSFHMIVANLVDGGFLELGPQGLRATAAGRQRLDAVLAQLLT